MGELRDLIKELNREDFGDFLLEKGVDQEVASLFVSNRISGSVFLKLTEDELKELIPTIGDRILVKELLKEVSQDCHDVALDFQDIETNADTGDLPSSSTCGSRPVDRPSHAEPSLNEWHLHFSIPSATSFSGCVQEAINTGVVTAKARKEIIQVLRTHMIVRTIYPTSEQYVSVCQNLVTKYPKLKDAKGNTSFGSWRLSLRNAFKNFRKGCPKRQKADAPSSLEPPSKRVKLHMDEEIDEEEYEEALEKLRELGKHKKGVDRKELKHLMEVTKLRRHNWIRKDRPLIQEILEKFPCLANSKWIRREFKAVVSFDNNVSSFMDTWPEWYSKLIKFSKLESTSRPLIRKLVEKLEEHIHDNNVCDAYCLELLYRLLFPRGMGKNTVFMRQFETCDVDLEKEISQIQQSAPYIVTTGLLEAENCQFFICSEQDILLESKSIRDAVIDLVATYFVFDITYPKPVNAILLFFQHYIFQLVDDQPVPGTTIKLVENLQKLD